LRGGSRNILLRIAAHTSEWESNGVRRGDWADGQQAIVTAIRNGENGLDLAFIPLNQSSVRESAAAQSGKSIFKVSLSTMPDRSSSLAPKDQTGNGSDNNKFHQFFPYYDDTDLDFTTYILRFNSQV